MHTQEEIVPGTNVRTYNTVKCHGCEKYGHYSSHCPEEIGQQNMIREDDKDNNTEDSEETESAGHIQIGDISMDGDSKSSDGSYPLNFSDFQFHQREGTSTN